MNFLKSPIKTLKHTSQRNIFSYLRHHVKNNNPRKIDVILHIHGGGFISNTSVSHYCYLNK